MGFPAATRGPGAALGSVGQSAASPGRQIKILGPKAAARSKNPLPATTLLLEFSPGRVCYRLVARVLKPLVTSSAAARKIPFTFTARYTAQRRHPRHHRRQADRGGRL